ncbi:MAG: DUF2997 domain-containing protein [Verrucomicrobiales bacterium]
MPQREFDITIGSDGTVEVQITGYKGKRCLEIAKMFEEVVGEINSQRETSEFYEPDEAAQISVEGRQ